jgi:hypothetical protein
MDKEYTILEIVEKDILLMLNGKNKAAFRCTCGCNVFRKVVASDNQLRYRCNGCGDIYLAEK